MCTLYRNKWALLQDFYIIKISYKDNATTMPISVKP